MILLITLDAILILPRKLLVVVTVNFNSLLLPYARIDNLRQE